jgi:hypothetical protein
MYEMLFHYYPAFVARVIDASRVQIWLQHPRCAHINYDLARTIVVDLDKAPSSPGVQWEDIDVDDNDAHPEPTMRGFTTLGPVFPHNYGSVGVYLSSSFCRRHAVQLGHALEEPPRAREREPRSGRPYEQLALVRKNHEGELLRFHGFHSFSETEVADGAWFHVVAHAGTSFTNRTRCPALLRKDDFEKNAPLWDAADAGDGTRVFIEQHRAFDVGLSIPKQPTGSGEGLIVSDSLPPGEPEPNGPLNVFGPKPYDEVLRIQKRLNKNYISLDRHTFADELQRLANNGCGPFTSLDLIGHSHHPDGVLRFDNIALNAAAITPLFSQAVADALRDLEIREVRILGCRTAVSAEAIAALQVLKRQLGDCDVRGTTGDVFEVHYARGVGFMEIRLLSGADLAIANSIHSSNPESPGFPLASESTTNLKPYLWSAGAEKLRALWEIVSPSGQETNYLEKASAMVVFVDAQNAVRAFDLIPVSDAPAELPPLRGIRLNFSERWVFYPLREASQSDAVYQLIGMSREARDPSPKRPRPDPREERSRRGKKPVKARSASRS